MDKLMYGINYLLPIIKKNPSSKIQLVLLFRYISLFITSLFFLTAIPYTPFTFKLGVIVSLYIAALILTNLLRKYIENAKVILWIIIIETIGLTLLLVPTGGISSPFIWYALNPVLLAASFLSVFLCWGVLTVFLSSATFIALMSFKTSIITIIEEYSYVYLVFLLMTLLFNLFIELVGTLEEKDKELLQLNEKLAIENGNYKEALELVTTVNEEINKYTAKMVAIEEQNRIANEIHDSVSQRLFGLVYSLHSLQMKSLTISREELSDEFQFLKQTSNTTMKELRKAIFNLSSIKKGEQPFHVLVQNYMKEFARLNDIKIDLQIIGDEAFIPSKLKKALYRIILESCGNSVRHGACHLINIKLVLSATKVELSILDDGVGINATITEQKKEHGIGLFNIKNITNSFGGEFLISERIEKGTKIYINIPNSDMFMEKVVRS